MDPHSQLGAKIYNNKVVFRLVTCIHQMLAHIQLTQWMVELICDIVISNKNTKVPDRAYYNIEKKYKTSYLLSISMDILISQKWFLFLNKYHVCPRVVCKQKKKKKSWSGHSLGIGREREQEAQMPNR